MLIKERKLLKYTKDLGYKTLLAGSVFSICTFSNISKAISKNNEKKPNIIFIMTDQQRYDTLGVGGNKIIKTPNLDKLAKGGARFTNAFTCSGQCMPSRQATLTGRYPHANGVQHNGDALSDSELTAGEILKKHGYKTIAIGKMHFARQDTNHGFDYYPASMHEIPEGLYKDFLKKLGYKWKKEDISKMPKDFMKHLTAGTSPLKEEHTLPPFLANTAISLLKKNKNKAFAMWISFSLPHPFYIVPKPWDSMYKPEDMPLSQWNPSFLKTKPYYFKQLYEYDYTMYSPKPFRTTPYYLKDRSDEDFKLAKAKYYGSISLVDKYIGKILDELKNLGLEENTILVFTSDHGDFLGDYRLAFKGTSGLDALVKVPFIIRYPKIIKAASIYDDLISNVDILPSLLDLVKIPHPIVKGKGIQAEKSYPLLQGQSFTPLLLGKSYKSREYVFFEMGASYKKKPKCKAIRTKKWKYIINYKDKNELYDLKKDPGELNNLFNKQEKILQITRPLAANIFRWLISTEYRPFSQEDIEY